jgi:hypothetical protein
VTSVSVPRPRVFTAVVLWNPNSFQLESGFEPIEEDTSPLENLHSFLKLCVAVQTRTQFLIAYSYEVPILHRIRKLVEEGLALWGLMVTYFKVYKANMYSMIRNLQRTITSMYEQVGQATRYVV